MKFTKILFTLLIALILAQSIQSLSLQKLNHKNKRQNSKAKNPWAGRLGMFAFNAMKTQAAVKCTGTVISGAYFYTKLSVTDEKFRQQTYLEQSKLVGKTVFDNSDTKAFYDDAQDYRKGDVSKWQLGSRVALRLAQNRAVPVAGNAVGGFVATGIAKSFAQRGLPLFSTSMMQHQIAQQVTGGVKGGVKIIHDELWMQQVGNDFVKDRANLDWQANKAHEIGVLLKDRLLSDEFGLFKEKANVGIRLAKKRSLKQKNADEKHMKAQFAMSLFDDLFKEKSNYQDNYCLAALEDLAGLEKTADSLIKDKAKVKDLKPAEHGGFIGAICPHLFEKTLDIVPYEHEIYYLSMNLNLQGVLEQWVQSKESIELDAYLQQESVKKLIQDNSELSFKAAQTIFYQLGEELNKNLRRKVRLSKNKKKSQSKKNKKQKDGEDGETCPVKSSKGIDLIHASVDASTANADKVQNQDLKAQIAAALKKVVERK